MSSRRPSFSRSENEMPRSTTPTPLKKQAADKPASVKPDKKRAELIMRIKTYARLFPQTREIISEDTDYTTKTIEELTSLIARAKDLLPLDMTTPEKQLEYILKLVEVGSNQIQQLLIIFGAINSGIDFSGLTEYFIAELKDPDNEALRAQLLVAIIDGSPVSFMPPWATLLLGVGGMVGGFIAKKMGTELAS